MTDTGIFLIALGMFFLGMFCSRAHEDREVPSILGFIGLVVVSIVAITRAIVLYT